MSNITYIPGGVCAAEGFRAAGIHCGIRKNKVKRDLALIVCDTPCNAAGVYTQNLVKGAPIIVTKKNLENGIARAIVCNSGNANTCNADGVEKAELMCKLVEKHTGISADDVIVASTGVIGQVLPITPIEDGFPRLVSELRYDGGEDAASAIMTTDTVMKEAAVQFTVGGKTCKLGGIAKGSGMIHPNMATMLVFVTSDVAISSEMLKKAIKADADDSFNMISVDGDTSTNDTFTVMCSGAAGNEPIVCEDEDYNTFRKALAAVTKKLCRAMAKDGEGATKLIECTVAGAGDIKTAKTVSKAVIASSLVKAAMFGSDANWGRVLCAIGYSSADVDINGVDVYFASRKGEVKVCTQGSGIDFSEEWAKTILSEDEIQIYIVLSEGNCSATAWGCDLTYDYVKINGDYRT